MLFVLFDFRQENVGSTAVVTINDLDVEAEIARTSKQQIKGLSGRDSLKDGQGMLFVYDDYAVRKFWMKDMKFPIDIIWIKDDRIIGIEENAAVPTSAEIPTFTSPAPVNYVLEVSAGFARKHGLKAGDKIIVKI